MPRVFDELELAIVMDAYRVFQGPYRNPTTDPGRLGTERLNASQRRDLMEIVKDRYEVDSTLITKAIAHRHMA
jgi:hypothetical protein